MKTRAFQSVPDSGRAAPSSACRHNQPHSGTGATERPPYAGLARRGPPCSPRDSATTRAFTLLELLTVIAIIGILAAITVPNLGSFKPNVTAAATRQLLDDVARARQLAIANHTTVYMVFVPTNFWTDFGYQNLPATNQNQASRLFDKQLTSYAFVCRRSIGDQPGRPTARYLSSWKTLPEGMYIPPQQFQLRRPGIEMDIQTNTPANSPILAYRILPFLRTRLTNSVPFPSSQAPIIASQRSLGLPYLAFDYMGRLAPEFNDFEYIPLAKGSVIYQRNPTNGLGTPNLPSVVESPPGNTTNAFTLIRVDKLTGRPHAEHQEIR